MSDQPDDPGQETPPADEAVVPEAAPPQPEEPPPPEEELPGEVPPEADSVVEPPPPAEEFPGEAPPEADSVVEPPPPAEEPPGEAPPEAEPVVEPSPPTEEPPGEAPPEAKPVEEPGENVEPVPEDESEALEPLGDAPAESSPEEAKPEEGGDEQVLPSTTVKAEDGAGETIPSSRRESTESEIQALTTQQILERLQKSYAQACKTLAVIGNIQRRESVLKLEEHQMELIKKFNKFENHLEQLGLATEESTQTSKHSCECKSVPSDDLKPPTPQDLLPQVIICGREEQVPKIIICESQKKANIKNNLAQLERERLLKTQKELVGKCEFMNEKLILKETVIANLHKQICSLQKENCKLRWQLSKSNQTEQQCQCLGTAQNVCHANCPVHCRSDVPHTDSPPPAREDSIPAQREVSQKIQPGACTKIESQNQPILQVSCMGSGRDCAPTCPNFKGNLPVVDEESKTHNENVSQHICSTTCPNFNINVPTMDECRKNSQIGPVETNNETENVEVEIQEQNLEGNKGIVPLDDEKKLNNEVCEPCPKTQIIMRLCNKSKIKPPTYCELNEEYNCLKKDFNNRMSELTTLRQDIVKHKEIAEQACVAQQKAEIELKNMSGILKSIEDKRMMMLVPKEQMMEMEQQIVVAKERFLESQDELEELRELTQHQSTQLEDYRSKFLQSHEQVEDQKGQIEMLELENSLINENVALEIQHVKNQFEVRLQALTPLPDLLKATQEKLVEVQQQQANTQRRCEDVEKELELANQKVREYARQLDDSVTSSNMELEGHGSTKKKLVKWEKKYNLLQEENAELKKKLEAMEEAESNHQKRLMEKLHEVAQLAATLEMLRVESARQVARAKERLDSVRQTLQAQVVALEQQVAESRAVARTARKDRDNIRQRMQCQIDSLNESFEQAQVTIRTLQEHVGFFNDQN